MVSLCDVNEQLGRERLAEFSLPSTAFTRNYDDMLADPSIDAIGIYTPDHLHAEHVIRALEAGKHVICTKPFIDSLASAKKVLAAVKKSGRHVMVGQSSRHFAPFARQREHFEEGILGELFCVEASYNADHRWFLAKPWARKAEFKWLYGGLSHPVDFVRWYLPRITEVSGYALLSPNGKKHGLVHADTFQFVMRDAEGRVARVSGAYSGPVVPNVRDSNMSCVLRGTKGASQGDYYDLRYAWKTDTRSALETFEDRDAHFFRFGGTPIMQGNTKTTSTISRAAWPEAPHQNRMLPKASSPWRSCRRWMRPPPPVNRSKSAKCSHDINWQVSSPPEATLT